MRENDVEHEIKSVKKQCGFVSSDINKSNFSKK